MDSRKGRKTLPQWPWPGASADIWHMQNPAKLPEANKEAWDVMGYLPSCAISLHPGQFFAFPKLRNRYLDSLRAATFPHEKVHNAPFHRRGHAAIDLSTVFTDTGGASSGASGACGEPGGLGARVSLSLALATFSQAMKRRKEVALGPRGFGEAPGFDGFWGVVDKFR